MKTILPLLVVAIALSATLQAFAGDAAATKASKPSSNGDCTKAKKELLTGSYIKKETKRKGLITDGADRVFVIDNATIQNTGAADLKQVLVRRGFRR